jgi:XTP/dITP diphosphohydrolase
MKKKKQLLIATTNSGKLREFREALQDLDIEILSLKDFPEIKNVEETGSTFEENALLKATQYGHQSGIPVIADDGGLEIDILGGAPGVYTRRWVDKTKDSSDDELIAHTLSLLEEVPEKKRTARLRLVCVFDDGEDVHFEESSIEGRIVEEAGSYEEGFPFRALLYIPQFEKLYGELTGKEHDTINHRRKAIEKLKPIIKEKLGI